MPFVYYCLLRFQSEGFFLPIAFLRFHSVGMPFAYYCVATVSELENAFCLVIALLRFQSVGMPFAFCGATVFK